MLRGGPLADKRVIRLLNLRFVPFYFNVGQGQPGYDAQAKEVVVNIDDRFAGSSVPTPPVWVLTPDLQLVATIDNYTPRGPFFDELVRILDENPEFAEGGGDEEQRTGLPAARLAEDLGQYERALDLYTELDEPSALLGRARIARYRGEWDTAARLLSDLEDIGGEAWTDQILVELAHADLAAERFAEARDLLTTALLDHPDSPRLGEMHYYAGVAAFRSGEKDWANLHWWWVLENLPDDNQYMRCYLATAADAMPYPNPELGGYRSSARMISHALADECRATAREDYERLLPRLESMGED